MMDNQQFLRGFVPESALPYCAALREKTPFRFVVSQARMSKLGDYRYEPSRNRHTITVNYNLNPYAFLITFIHEVAHLRVQLEFGSRVQPHGKEWKRMFSYLMNPLLKSQVFPPDILGVLSDHMLNPKASSGSDARLSQVLRRYNENQNEAVLLGELSIQEVFTFRKRVFRKEGKKRTRALCTEIHTGRQYLIPEVAEVERHEA